MATKVIMQGALDPGLLMDMLQVMNRRRNLNGYVGVSDSAETGRIWIQEGAILAANWKDRQDELAVESMLRLKQGRFEVVETDALPAKTISKDTVALLMLCTRAIGRDALMPAVPARNPSPQNEDKISMLVPALQVGKTDEPMPAPAYLPLSSRSHKRGFAMVEWWGLRIAAAIFLIFLAGTGIMTGKKAWAARQLPQVVQKPTVPVAPPPAPVIVQVPSKPMTIMSDVWPEIMISALAASGKNHWCAILNGQILGVGEQVDGVIVRAIRANGVVLEYQGQRRFLCAAKK